MRSNKVEYSTAAGVYCITYDVKVPTKTNTPKRAIPTAIGGGKSNSNLRLPTDSLGAVSELSANLESDVTPAASTGKSNANSDYSESSDNSPASLDNSQNPWHKSTNLRKCMRTPGHSSKSSPLPGFSSSRPTRSTLRRLSTRRSN